MIGAFYKGFEQLSDPKTRKVIWSSIAWSVLIFAALWGLAWTAIASSALFSLHWLDVLVDALGMLATLALTWFLFPAVVTAVGSLMLESVADAVEERHYPALDKPSGPPLSQLIMPALKFTAVSVGLNLLTLPFIVAAPPLFPFIYYALNGYLLSREYFELVAFRRIPPKAARALRLEHSKKLFAAGVIIAFLLTVPIVNLLAPAVATATFVHLFERWRAQSGATATPRF
ncbi:uncharacterized protein involved in cysteine biosynthesis [Varunaivibrio sulfuroxidans]|uniref:Uncharacterized protein involved in cysteine biosynthesis n=2 Tax=Varunaivibrio sulfuroxidans TaxID=1773489 RepID=A0A4R3JFL3_9PROT|nr:uncharacterized protein involved in cysteine biosynthesis [Varunaivibrio sulfuroxidans]